MRKKDILVILIPSAIFVLLWIIFSIHHTINTSTISDETSIQIVPVSPNFDTKTIENLKTRQVVEPIYELSGATQIQTIPIPTPSIIPVSTQSAKIASTGGALVQ